MSALASARIEEPAESLAARSRAWRTPAEGAAGELVVGIAATAAIAGGAFQRRCEIRTGDLPLVRRGSGGGAVEVSPGTVWIQLCLARPDALVPCTADKLLNRYVRPLLRAIGRVAGAPASYFGRDWISVRHQPIAHVGFAHDARTGRALVEAIVGTGAAFASPGRVSFLGKEPAALAVDAQRLAAAVERAYGELAPLAPAPALPAVASVDGSWSDPPWTARREEGIGLVAAGPDASGRIRLGGELMASIDAIERIEAGEDTDAAFGDGAVTLGIRSLATLRDVYAEALRTSPGGPRRTA